MSFQDSDIDHDDPNKGEGAMWGWIAAICVVILIVFVLVGEILSPNTPPKKSGQVPIVPTAHIG